jgi:peptidoglycan/xylan/chitin deacetylase (PgdA/CDA1 family)
VSLRAPARWLAYRSGALGALHRAASRDRLTVVMFHRVLREDSLEWARADPVYAVTDRLFADCLRFFARHYRPIDAGQLLDACAGRRALPGRPLLITFDDGWADNAETALPLLRRAGLPAVVFTVAGLIDEEPEPWWEETLTWAWRRGRLVGEAGRRLCRAAGLDRRGDLGLGTPHGLLVLAAGLAELPAFDRRDLLSRFAPRTGERQMLTPGQLRRLAAEGVAIGSHGMTHSSLPLSREPLRELASSRQRLGTILQGAGEPEIFSYPHGLHTDALRAQARDAGYRAQFTSEAHLNRLDRGFPLSDCFGRIPIEAAQIADGAGRLRPERLAGWLVRRPTR